MAQRRAKSSFGFQNKRSRMTVLKFSSLMVWSRCFKLGGMVQTPPLPPIESYAFWFRPLARALAGIFSEGVLMPNNNNICLVQGGKLSHCSFTIFFGGAEIIPLQKPDPQVWPRVCFPKESFVAPMREFTDFEIPPS